MLVSLTQWIIYNAVIAPVSAASKITPTMSGWLPILFMTVTATIAISGYYINDYFDSKADKVNKPNAPRIKPAFLLYAYFTTIVIGFLLALYIAINIGKLHLAMIYPLAIILLYSYSAWAKKKGLIGNIIVALFTAFVPGILLVAEPQLLTASSQRVNWAFLCIISFSCLSFFVNLIRELTKDIEDLEGDKIINSLSMPITLGVHKTKAFIYFNTLLLLIGVGAWTWFSLTIASPNYALFNIIFLIPLLIMSIFQLKKATKKEDFTKLSKLYKWIMVVGLLSLLLFSRFL